MFMFYLTKARDEWMGLLLQQLYSVSNLWTKHLFPDASPPTPPLLRRASDDASPNDLSCCSNVARYRDIDRGRDLDRGRGRGRCRRRRLRSVDLLRGFFVIMMVLNHFAFYWSNEAGQQSGLYFVIQIAIGWFIPSSFLLLMGISQAFSSSSSSVSSAAEELPEDYVVFQKALIRSLFLVGVDKLTTWTAWWLSDHWECDILTLMGVSTMVLHGCRHLSSWCILMLSSLVLLVAPTLRAKFVDTTIAWGEFGQVPISDFIFPANLLLETIEVVETVTFPPGERNENQGQPALPSFFLSSCFPIFPWIAFPLIGFVIGRRMMAITTTTAPTTVVLHPKEEHAVQQQFHRDLLPLSAIGCALIALGLGGAWYGSQQLLLHNNNIQPNDNEPDVGDYYDYSIVPSLHLSPLTFEPLSTTLFMVQLGVFLLALCGTYYIFDGVSKDGDDNHMQQSMQYKGEEKDDRDGCNRNPPISRMAVKDDVVVVESFLQRLLQRTSRFALTIFLVHHNLVGWPLKVHYYITNEYRGYNWMGVWTTLAYGILAVVFLEWLIAIWEVQYHGAYSLHWLLERLTFYVPSLSWKCGSLKKEKRG